MEKAVKSDLENLVIIGDRLLISPKGDDDRTKSGLFLPPGVEEKEEIRSGWVVKTGPGYPIPFPSDDSEPWKESHEKIKYVPLQAKEGDFAIFLKAGAHEVTYREVKYYIVPQSSVLMLERDEGLFD